MQISPTLIFHLIFCIFIFHYFFGDLLLLHNKVSYCENHLFKPSKYQCCPHIETSQLICCANQLTGFYMRATLALNELNFQWDSLSRYLHKISLNEIFPFIFCQKS